jgi:SlyX protein
MQHLEERIAHLTRTVDELSDIVRAQHDRINQLTRRVELLMQREASRETDSGSHTYTADQRPPHW